eukprot:Sdes_comp20784_c0_seq1m16887
MKPEKLADQDVVSIFVDKIGLEQNSARETQTFPVLTNRSNSILSQTSLCSIATEFQDCSVRVQDARERLKHECEQKPAEVVAGKSAVKIKKELKKEVEMDEHLLSLPELEARMGTNLKNGLSPAEAEKRYLRDGPNIISPPPTTPLYILYLLEIFTGFAIVLWVAAVLCLIGFIIENFVDSGLPEESISTNLTVAVVLILVILVSGTFSFYQNTKSAKVMQGFKNMVALETRVLREGEIITIPAEKLAIGDICFIYSGDRIPADIILVDSANFKVDNSSLTGESEPQKRFPASTHDNPLESANIAFSTTTCVEGHCSGVVISIGDHTMIGRLASLVSSAGPLDTPMGREIRTFIKYITILAGVLGIVFFGVGLLWGENWMTSAITMIGIIVANVPEGLPSIIAVSLTLAAKRMAKKNVLVTKNLQAVETLGRTSVICSDKTGTLTQNRMNVSHVYYDCKIHDVLAREDISTFFAAKDGTFWELYRTAALCSRAAFEASQQTVAISERKVVGDASETAILKFCEQILSVNAVRDDCPKIVEIPFCSANKFQISIHESPDGVDDPRLLLVMKGAPERIVERCSHIMNGGKSKPFDEKHRAEFLAAYETLGGYGERVLGMCSFRLPENLFPRDFEFSVDPPNFPLTGFVFLGLVSLIDPPRESVPFAIEQCNSAGIKVVMVTGDHPLTAEAISKKIGLLTGDARKSRIVIHGDRLRAMSDEELDKVLQKDEIVFARTSPQQKLRIVEGFQKRGEVVAVTGDGVNDSPALKQADCGIAMGISGSDVSKEAADLILVDDNFGSIVNGIQEGRVIFDNLKKSIVYSLSSKCPETIPFIFSTIFRLPTPLTPILVLSIDVGTDLLPAIALAYEEAEEGVMKRAPKDPKTDKLVTLRSVLYAYLWLGMLQSIAGMCIYFLFMYRASEGSIVEGGCWKPLDLFFQVNWIERNTILRDSCGFLWDFEQRDALTIQATSSYFLAVVIVRVGVLLMCKTSKKSLFVCRSTKLNQVLLIGILFMIGLASCIVTIPGVQEIFGTEIMSYVYWLLPIPFCLAVIFLEEMRKFILRRLSPQNSGLSYYLSY